MCKPFPRFRSNRSRLANAITNSRTGAVAVLSAFCLVIVLMMAAFAIDIGYLMVARTDMQRTADAAVQSAVLEYRSHHTRDEIFAAVREAAKTAVEANPILRTRATVSLNPENHPDGDIVLGHVDLRDPNRTMTTHDPSRFNAVTVRVTRSVIRNGAINLCFARIFGLDEIELKAEATAALVNQVSGFELERGQHLPILPITISEISWEQQLQNPEDQLVFDPRDHSIFAGRDGTPELNLFPDQTSSAGNFGTLNIGTENNSTRFLGQQIVEGVSADDLDSLGGSFELKQLGTEQFPQLMLSGNPGISGGIEDDLQAIVGDLRIIPIFRSVEGSGNNAQFVIVRLEAVRIMAVELSGRDKRVTIQPATMSLQGLIPGQAITSGGIYSGALIVQ